MRTVFVERDDELARLASAFGRAGDGVPAAVLIGGEAGVGKSRLVTEFAATLSATTPVLVGGCLDLGENGLPFAPFTEVLRELLSELGAGGLAKLLPGGHTGELGRLLPALAPPAADSSGLARARLFEQVLALLRGLAETRPVMLVVEDIHWADRSSRDLLTFLVRNQRAAPGLLIVVTYRTDQLGRDHPVRPLLSDLARVPWVDRLELGRLSRKGVTIQLRGLLGHEPDAGLTEDVFGRSAGNPLFVEALLRCRDEPGPDLPESIRDLLAGPVARLAPPAQDVVRTAAAGGVHIGHELLAAVTGLDDVALSSALRPAVAANLMLVAGDGYVFRHALIREVLLDDLLPAERARLHVRYAEALERDPSLAPPGRAAPQLASHWCAVSSRHATKALTASWHAAGEAARSLAYAEQLLMLTHVLRVWDRVEDAAGHLGVDRSTVLETAIEAAASAGDVTRAMSLIETALASDAATDPVRHGRLRMRRGELRHALGQPGGVDDLRAAAELVPEKHPVAAVILVTLAYRLLTVPREEEGRTVARAAIAAARRSGDVQSEVLASIDLAYADARTGDIDALARARETATQLGDHVAIRHALRREADVLHSFGRYAEAIETARRGLAVCAEAGLARTKGPAHAANLAESLIAVGRWDEAAEAIENALEYPPIPGLDAYLLVLHGTIGLARGDLDLAATTTGYAREVFARGYPDTQDLLPLALLEVDLRVERGEPAEAVRLVEHALTLPHIDASPRYLWPVLVAGARVAHADLVTRLRALAARLPVIGPVQRAHRLTFAATLDSVVSAWDRAAAAWAELGQPYPQAHALVRAAEVAISAGDQPASRLRAAAGLADRLGAAPLRASIDRLARLTRVPLVEATSDRHGLTPRELEVLHLVADGRTNRQIAEELFISAKTASVHVSNILAKLEVSGRVQAATAAHRLNLLSR